MPDFSLNQQKGSLLLKNKPKSSNNLLEMVDAISNKTSSNTNIVTPKAKATDVAKNAADANNTSTTATADATSAGVSTDITPATGTTGVSSGMEVKTTGGKKRYQLGFNLSGYKSIIQKGNQQNTISGMGASLGDDDIKWLVSMYNIYENGKKGFNQAEVVRKKDRYNRWCGDNSNRMVTYSKA